MSAAALLARAQVDPFAADLDAFIAFVPRAVLNGCDGAQVDALTIRQEIVLLLTQHLMDEGDGN